PDRSARVPGPEKGENARCEKIATPGSQGRAPKLGHEEPRRLEPAPCAPRGPRAAAMLGLVLDHAGWEARAVARLRAAQAEQAAAAQQEQLRVAQYQRQAELAGCALDPDVAELADSFDIEDALARQLDCAVRGRPDLESTLLTLWDHLEGADDPREELKQQVGRLFRGDFVVQASDHAAVVAFCKKYELDETATKYLAEALAVRERDFEASTKRDLEKLAVHMEHSSRALQAHLHEAEGAQGGLQHRCGVALLH
ncbi:unnamed protein product, partial [Prorocentrum cordatum]